MEAAAIDKKLVQDYLKTLQKIDVLMAEKESFESKFASHVAETGEMVLCNLIKVSYRKNPPKLTAFNVFGQIPVTAEMREKLTEVLKGTDFVSTTTSLSLAKIHAEKDSNKDLKKALKQHGLTTEQSEKMSFDRIVSAKK